MTSEGTVYQPGIPAVKGHRWRSFFLVIGALLVVRTVNVGFLWYLQSREIKSQSFFVSDTYQFLGPSTGAAAREKLALHPPSPRHPTAVVSYFNLVHSAIFLIDHRGERTFLELGRLAVYIQPGLSWVYIHPEDIVEVHRQAAVQTKYFGQAPLAMVFEGLARLFANGDTPGTGISYVEKPLEDSRFLRWSYFCYFFLPLIFIVWFSSMVGPGFHVSFFFYVGLFFLFDFKRVLVTVPFFWLFDFFGGAPSPAVVLVFSMSLLLIFFTLFVRGLLRWKSMEPDTWARPMVLFFILLPLFLRL